MNAKNVQLTLVVLSFVTLFIFSEATVIAWRFQNIGNAQDYRGEISSTVNFKPVLSFEEWKVSRVDGKKVVSL